MKIALQDFIAKLPLPATKKWPEGVWDIEAFKHGSMSLILFAPQGKDYQTPHEQDELYIVAKGSGTFIRHDVIYSFGAGDVLFVPAGEHHHFENMSDDLTMWVVFWGPKGGEQSGKK
jgi:mannose-6-phosphate isomerase-like protein (cupin superfamily)